MARKSFEVSFDITGSLGSSFRSAFGSASAQMDKLRSSAQDLKSSLRTLDSQYKKGQVSAAQYGAAQSRLSRQIERSQQAQSKLLAAQRRNQELQQANDDIKTQMLETAAVGAPFVLATKTAMDFEQAMLGVAKQVDGARSDSGQLTKVYYGMREEIFKMGREMGVPNEELARLMAFSAKMGVPKQHLVSYTKEVAKMAESFEMLPEEAGTQMGMLANIFKIKFNEVGKMGDMINYLDDKSLASGRDIMSVMMRSGGVAQSAGMTESQLAALSATFLSLGKSEEVAGTATTALIRELSLASEQPDRFHTALTKLGMTSKEVTKGMAKDAQGTILTVLDKIKNLKLEEQTSVLTGLFGKEYGDDIAVLASGIDKYKEMLGLLDDEKLKGSMDREFEARNQTSYAQLEKLKNSTKEVAVNMGDAILPTLNDIFNSLGSVSNKLAEFAKEYPNVTKVLIGGTAALVAGRIGWLGLRFGINSVLKPLSGAKELLAKLNLEKVTKQNAKMATQKPGRNLVTKMPKSKLPAQPKHVPQSPKVLPTKVYSSTPKPSPMPKSVPIPRNSPFTHFPKQTKEAGKTAGKSIGKASSKLATAGKVISKAALPLSIAAEAYSVYKSNDKKKAVVQSASGIAGGIGGAKAGALIGTSLLPGIGTAIGGLLGGLGGYVAGKWAGGKAVDAARNAGNNSSTGTANNQNVNPAAATLNASLQKAALTANQLNTSLSILATYTAQASGWMVGAFYGLQTSGMNLNTSLSILASYSAQASGWMVGTFYGLQAHGMNLNMSLSILASYTAQASGWMVGTFYGLQAHGMNLNMSLSILASYTAQASGWMVGTFYGLQANGMNLNTSLSILASYTAQASGWMVGAFHPLTASASVVRGNLSILASYTAQASGWVASINGIQSSAAAVKSALSGLAARINAVPAPSVSAAASGKGPKKYARGGFINKPHLGLVGEAGPESIIPLKPGNSRSLSLWQKTGEMLGVSQPNNLWKKASESFSGGSAMPSQGIAIHAPFSPSFTVAGGNNIEEFRQNMEASLAHYKAQFESLLAEAHLQQRRKRF